MSVSRIVFELEAEGFTHIARRCSGCHTVTALSFAEVRARATGSVWAATLNELVPYLGCEACPGGSAVEITARKLARVPRGGPKTPIGLIRRPTLR